MPERPDLGSLDRDRMVQQWLQPAAATLVAMLIAFGLVAGVLLARESLVLGSTVSRVVALVTMYLLPHVVAGFWIGRQMDPALEPALVAGLAPVLFLLIALAAFGGPIATPFRAPLVTVGAVIVWSIAFGVGMVLGGETREYLTRERLTRRLRDA